MSNVTDSGPATLERRLDVTRRLRAWWGALDGVAQQAALNRLCRRVCRQRAAVRTWLGEWKSQDICVPSTALDAVDEFLRKEAA